MLEPKHYRGVMCCDTYVLCVGNAMCKENLAVGLKNGIRNVINFHASSRKSEKVQFDGLVLSKAHKSLDEKVQKTYGPEERSKGKLIL